MTIRWQGLWAMVAALICDISIVTQYVTMSLPSILVNYDWLSKRKVGDVGHVYWYEYGSKTAIHTPTSGEQLLSFGQQGNKEM
ncbi:transmembrane protein, putative [Medicago truncatula]|uniref:Transmembrane protein, putative n=1 Tax=Medicago truncatula TaxID=3880 RepID=G7L1W4_MEDTR|nr:transmembrane protein, putative [Medicago truncatula]